jgi:hypothetical protein
MLFGFLLFYLLMGGSVEDAFRIGCLWILLAVTLELVLWGSIFGLFALAFLF